MSKRPNLFPARHHADRGPCEEADCIDQFERASVRTKVGGTQRQLAGGLIRTFVVGSATLAILLVCFSIYQYSQLDPLAAVATRGPRLPPLSSPASDSAAAPTEPTPAVQFGPGAIGPGRNVRLSVYAPQGTRARFELAVSSYTPVEGATDELLLRDPEIRLRTNAGNAIRVTAQVGRIEAKSKSGGFEPQRGELSGGVLLEIDRLSEETRRALPEPRRSQPQSEEIVKVEMERMTFDIEFAKVNVPGALRLIGKDVDLAVNDLEVRFNDADNRIEYLRVGKGGRVELRDVRQASGWAGISPDGNPSQRITLVDWLRATLQAKLDAAAARSAAATQTPPAALVDDGIPVFRNQDERPKGTSQRYFARFEDQVVASQFQGLSAAARLEAAVLDVYREVSPDERTRAAQEGTQSAPTASVKPQPDPAQPQERIVLAWEGRLFVEALAANDSRFANEGPSVLTATGSPVRLLGPDGDATAAKLVFRPAESKSTLQGSEEEPVVIHASERGTVRGSEVVYRRSGDRFDLHVAGPGGLTQDAGQSSSPSSMVGIEGIEFSESLDVQGRQTQTTKIDLSGAISSVTVRSLESATFRGRVRAHRDNTEVQAEEVHVGFGSAARKGSEARAIEVIQARRNVVMNRGTEHLSAGEVDIQFATQDDDRSVPVALMARNQVRAVEGSRQLRAEQHMILDLVSVVRGPSVGVDSVGPWPPDTDLPSSTAKPAFQAADSKGVVRTDVALRRIRAAGSVEVTDPEQNLDLNAELLDCALRDGRTIETALITGHDQRPANVQLRTLSVAGKEVKLHVLDEWVEVPGAGRMTFQSRKDLDGRRLDQPTLIAVTWTDHLKYQGRENRAVFSGGVHASSRNTNTFDADRLEVEFDPSPAPAPRKEEPVVTNWVPWMTRFLPESARSTQAEPLGIGSKQVAALLATGNIRAETVDSNPQTGVMETRVSIRGPKLSLNLRDEISKMTVEGTGTLLLEDFRFESASDPPEPSADGFLTAARDGGPSKTLISWRELMWYDFSIQQTRFEGDVRLTHFSGEQLASIVQMTPGGTKPTGTQTYLACDVLSADFQEQGFTDRSRSTPRLGRLSGERLKQFHARGSVALEAPSHHLSLAGDLVAYDRERDLLAVHGTQARAARILLHKPREYPQEFSGERFFYNFSTRCVEWADPTYKRR